MMRRLRSFWRAGNSSYPVKPLNVIGLVVCVINAFVLIWDVTTLHDGLIFILALIAIVACGGMWVKHL